MYESSHKEHVLVRKLFNNEALGQTTLNPMGYKNHSFHHVFQARVGGPAVYGSLHNNARLRDEVCLKKAKEPKAKWPEDNRSSLALKPRGSSRSNRTKITKGWQNKSHTCGLPLEMHRAPVPCSWKKHQRASPRKASHEWCLQDYSIPLLSLDSVYKYAQYSCSTRVGFKLRQKQGRSASPQQNSIGGPYHPPLWRCHSTETNQACGLGG